jgi:hypothetical protein
MTSVLARAAAKPSLQQQQQQQQQQKQQKTYSKSGRMIKKRKPVDIGFDPDSDLRLLHAKQRRMLPSVGEIGSFEWNTNEEELAANVVDDIWKRRSFDLHESFSDVDDDGDEARVSPSNFASMPPTAPSTRTESSPPTTQTPPPPPPPENNTTTTEIVVSSAVSALAQTETTTTTNEIHDARLALMQMQHAQALKELEVELAAAKKMASACRTALDNEAAERDEANKLLDAEQAAHAAAKEKIAQLERDNEVCRSSMEAHMAIMRDYIKEKNAMEAERAALLARAEKAESELQRALERIKTLERDAAAALAGAKQPSEFGVPARKRIRDFSGKPRALVISGGHIEEERAADEARSAEYARLNALFVDAGEAVRTLTARLFDCEARIDAFCEAMHADNARALDANLLDLYVTKNNTWNELLCAIHEEACARLRFNEAKKNVDLLQTGVLYQLHRSERALEIRASPQTTPPAQMNT